MADLHNKKRVPVETISHLAKRTVTAPIHLVYEGRGIGWLDLRSNSMNGNEKCRRLGVSVLSKAFSCRYLSFHYISGRWAKVRYSVRSYGFLFFAFLRLRRVFAFRSWPGIRHPQPSSSPSSPSSPSQPPSHFLGN